MLPHLRFEPGFRIPAIQGIGTIGCIGTPQPSELGGPFSRDASTAEPAVRANSRPWTRKLSSHRYDPQFLFPVSRASAAGRVPGAYRDFRSPPDRLVLRAPAYVRHGTRKREYCAAAGSRNNKRRQVVFARAGRKIENQALHSERWLALAQIVEPDQTERENAIGMAGIRRGADGGPCRRALPQECARVGRREVCSRSASVVSSASL
jgi:hypothetical protein